MDMALTTRLVFILTIGLVCLCVFLVAGMRRPTRLFLFDLGRPLTEGDLARAQRTQAVAVLCAVVGIAGSLWISDPDAAVLFALICPTLPILWLIAEMVAAVRSAEPASVPQEYVALDSPPGVLAYVSAPLQLLNVAAIAGGAAVVAWIIERLPDRVPLHWNAAGEVDRWGSPAEHWLLLPILLFDTGILWMILIAIAAERWALPPEDQDRFVALQRRRRTLLARMVEWVLVGINLGMAVMWVMFAAGGLPGRGGLSALGLILGLVLIAAASIAPLAVYLPWLMRVAEEIKEIAGTEVLGTRSDGWRWGGLIYYAPDDPELFVPKSLGIGQTLNFARFGAWVFLAVVLGMPILIAVLLLFIE